MIPACRIAPPKRCLKTHASSMNARDPASTAPTGAPSPLVRSSQTESNWAAKARAGGARCSPPHSSAGRRPCGGPARPRAPRRDRLDLADRPADPAHDVGGLLDGDHAGAGHEVHRGPHRLAHLRRGEHPARPGSGRNTAPTSAAAPPASYSSGCAVSCSRISSPARQCTANATWLHMVPEGRNSAASLPSSSATMSCSRLTVGSSNCCSSPTSASHMKRRMAGRGAGDGVAEEVDRDGGYGSFDPARADLHALDPLFGRDEGEGWWPR